MNTTLLNDEELVHLYVHTQRNDYFDVLYARYVNKVYRRCQSFAKSEAEAKDFTQDIFIRVLANLNRFRNQSAFSTWLYSVSYNHCVDQTRRAKRLNESPLGDNTVNLASETDDFLIDSDTKISQVSAILKKLPVADVALLRMKYEQELDIRFIAQAVGASESAIKMRLKRIRDKVREVHKKSFSSE